MKSFTQVEGVKVVDAQLAKSALSKPDKPVYFKGTQELLLEDGRVLYGCIWCGVMTDPKIGKLRLHQRYSCPDRPASEHKPVAKPKPYPPWTKSKAENLINGKKPDAEAIPAPSPRREPPPSGASDILAALRAGDPSTEEMITAKKTIQTLSRDLTTVIGQRDAWKNKYEDAESRYSGLEAEMNKIRDLLRQRGLM